MWIMHSAKGTTWKEHKYIKKENGRYIYADNDKNAKKAIELAKNAETVHGNDGKVYKPEDIESSKLKYASGKGSKRQYVVEQKMRDGTVRSSIYSQSTIDKAYPKSSKEKRNFKKKKITNTIKSISKYPKESLLSSGNNVLSKLGLKDASDKALRKVKSKVNAEKTRRKVQRF